MVAKTDERMAAQKAALKVDALVVLWVDMKADYWVAY